MQVHIYTKDGCPSCVMAKKWLTENDFDYREFDLNDNSARQEFYTMMTETYDTEVKTVPVILTREGEGGYRTLVGGFRELLASDILERRGLSLDSEDF